MLGWGSHKRQPLRGTCKQENVVWTHDLRQLGANLWVKKC